MHRKLLQILAVPIAALPIAEPMAQDTPVAVEASITAAEVPAPRVPFSPPVNEPLHYRITRSFEGVHAPLAYVTDQILTFSAGIGDGWQLKIETRSVTAGGKTFTPTSDFAQMLVQDHVTWLHAPMTVELAANGSLLRMADWQSYGQGLTKLPIVIPARSANGDPQSRSAMKKMIQDTLRQFAAGPAERAISLATPWNDLLGYGMREYTPGTAREWSTMETFMKGEAVVTYDGKTTFTPQTDGGMVVETETTASPEGFAEAVDTARSRGTPEALREAAEVQRYGPWMNDYDAIAHYRAVLDSRGVIRSATITHRMERHGHTEARQIVELRLIDPEVPLPATPAAASSVPAPL